MATERPRRRYPKATAAWVFVAVIIVLGLIIARGPTRFFQAPDVQSDAACTVRHCPGTADEAPRQDQIFRRDQ